MISAIALLLNAWWWCLPFQLAILNSLRGHVCSPWFFNSLSYPYILSFLKGWLFAVSSSSSRARQRQHLLWILVVPLQSVLPRHAALPLLVQHQDTVEASHPIQDAALWSGALETTIPTHLDVDSHLGFKQVPHWPANCLATVTPSQGPDMDKHQHPSILI